MNKLVSAIITTYNRIEYLKAALSSVQKQNYPNIEIVIVDGSDNEETKNYISKYPDIIYVHSKVNHPNILRNLGIQCSNGKFIAFLDDDDSWEVSKIKKQVECFENEDIGLCYTGKNIIDSNHKKIKYSYKKGKFSSLVRSIMWDNFIGVTSSIMIKKNIIDSIGNFDESLPALQDYDFCIRACKNFKIRGINEALVSYKYSHAKNQVSKNFKNFNIACKILKTKYPNNYMLKFGLYKLKIKRRIKTIYE